MRVDNITPRINPSFCGIRNKLVKPQILRTGTNSKPKTFFKDMQKNELPVTLGMIGFILPIPFASVVGFVLGTAIVKLKKYFNNNKPS